MRITALMENTTYNKALYAKHGLSLYIETNTHKILFDMGPNAAFADNALALGVDLSAVDIAVVSHGHYDHGRGLNRFLEINNCARVYVNEHAFESHLNAKHESIGLDTSPASCDRLVLVQDELKIDNTISLFTCNNSLPIEPIDSCGLLSENDGAFKPDIFLHEQYLLITQGDKRVLFTGCSHKGILNLVEWFKPDVLVGGFHFMEIHMDDAGKEHLRSVAKKLMKYKTLYYTCHCTGSEQYEYMKGIMGNKLHYLHCGDSIEI